MSAQHVCRIAAIAVASTLTLAALFVGNAVLSIPGRAETCRPPAPASTYSMEILVDGRPLSTYFANGTTYVEALKGREYAVRLTNRTGERVAVALAVDGLNSIDARHTSAREAHKWILAPWETVTLSGWQTSSGTARRFVFTSEAKSYGSWLGRTSDLGIISAAFFREARRAEKITVAPAPEPMLQRDQDEGVAAGVEGGDAAKEKAASGTLRAPKDELAATGIGREIEHHVVQVDFDEEDAPASTISVRYEYHEALVRLGVIPPSDDALARRERARGFADNGFAPDPYRGR
jgi:hypothetical protein